jgi:hypothetical protein
VEAHNDDYHAHVYDKPSKYKEDEANGPKFLSVPLPDPRKKSGGYQAKKYPNGVNVTDFGNDVGCTCDYADYQRRSNQEAQIQNSLQKSPRFPHVAKPPASTSDPGALEN